MDLFDQYPIYYKEVNTQDTRGSACRLSVLRLDGPNSGLFLNGWQNGSKISITSCYEFTGFKDVTGLETVMDHYKNGKDWIESEIVDKEYFEVAIKSLVNRDVRYYPKEEFEKAYG